jgi:formylglycine-generating enzyme required for sulfatase activity
LRCELRDFFFPVALNWTNDEHMKSVVSMWSVIALCLLSASSIITESSTTNELDFKISQTAGGAVQIRFRTTPDRRYQVYMSTDLVRWEALGNMLEGTGGTITVDYNAKVGKVAFFEITSEPLAILVPLQINKGTNQTVQLSFQGVTNKTYIFYGSGDLKQWVVLSDLIQGVGGRMTFDYYTGNGTEVFFRLETAQVIPVTNMVRIPSGTFFMGSPRTEKDRDLDEDPLTEVSFALGFWMGKYEVTQREYEALMGDNPSGFPGDPNRPVEQITWSQAAAYCVRLTALEKAAGRLPPGFFYRLPTEAEFEYASRAGSTNRFSFGDDLDYSQLADYAWYDKNSGGATHPVGQKKPNAFGLYDMHGNVWEWCFDWYMDPYPGGAIIDPHGPGVGRARVFRGGGWDYFGSSCRSAYRNNVAPENSRNFLGFRVVLSAVTP